MKKEDIIALLDICPQAENEADISYLNRMQSQGLIDKSDIIDGMIQLSKIVKKTKLYCSFAYIRTRYHLGDSYSGRYDFSISEIEIPKKHEWRQGKEGIGLTKSLVESLYPDNKILFTVL